VNQEEVEAVEAIVEEVVAEEVVSEEVVSEEVVSEEVVAEEVVVEEVVSEEVVVEEVVVEEVVVEEVVVEEAVSEEVVSEEAVSEEENEEEVKPNKKSNKKLYKAHVSFTLEMEFAESVKNLQWIKNTWMKKIVSITNMNDIHKLKITNISKNFENPKYKHYRVDYDVKKITQREALREVSFLSVVNLYDIPEIVYTSLYKFEFEYSLY
jgi:hypothetical protein